MFFFQHSALTQHSPGFYSETGFFFWGGGKMVRGKCALGRGLGPSPQESASVPIRAHLFVSVYWQAIQDENFQAQNIM